MTRKKSAFLIGVTDYGGGASDLDFCRKDVDLLEDVLNRKGFACTKGVNPVLRDTLSDLQAVVAETAEPEDTLLFYFTGHGAEAFGEQFLQGPRSSFQSLNAVLNHEDILRLSEVLDVLSYSNALKLIVVDACRSSLVLSSGDTGKFGENVMMQRRNAFQRISNCVVCFASADGQKSYGAAPGSAFTLALSKGLRQYDQDFLQVVQNAVGSLKGAAKQQIPWVYSSTFSSLFPDRLAVTEHLRVSNFREPVPREFVGFTGGGLVGVSAQSILKMQNGLWIETGRLKDIGTPRALSFATKSRRAVALRKLSLYVTNSSEVEGEPSRLIRLRSLPFDSAFGVSISPSGQSVAGFGKVPNDNGPGLVSWSVDEYGKSKPLRFDGIPDLQCNACEWMSDEAMFAAFSASATGRSYVYRFSFDSTKFVGVNCYQSENRITALAAAGDGTVWLGDVNGTVTYLPIHSGEVQSLSRSRPLDPQSRGGRKGWHGKDDEYFSKATAVTSFAINEDLGVLAAQFYDGVVSFFDTWARVEIVSFPEPKNTHKRRIVKAGADSFYSLGGMAGTEFRVRVA